MLDIGNVFILGDSYSTFEKFIPTGYAFWYPAACRAETDVNNVSQTWWHQLLNETESTLLLNCSFSGTTICNTGYGGENCTNKSFVGRLDKLIENNYFNENSVDTFIIFGGTNDSWANSPIGEVMYSGWEKESLFSVLPAFCYLLHRVKTCVPNARVICIINTDLKETIANNFKVACEKYGVETVQLENVGKMSGHPNIDGMRTIKNQVLSHLQKSIS